MATTHAPENSVTLALAELDRLEQARANFLSAKRAAREQLGRQQREIESLRAQLLAERPRAWARVRRERVRRLELDARTHTQLAAQQAADFSERIAAAQLELEHKRRRLAALEAMPADVRPARRVLEWSVPAAATVLVAFLGLLAVGETEAEAGAPQVLVDAAPMLDVGPAYAPFMISPDAEQPAPAAKDDEATKKKPSKKKSSKPKSSGESSKPKSDGDGDAKPPVIKKNSRPIELGDSAGDPLG